MASKCREGEVTLGRESKLCLHRRDPTNSSSRRHHRIGNARFPDAVLTVAVIGADQTQLEDGLFDSVDNLGETVDEHVCIDLGLVHCDEHAETAARLSEHLLGVGEGAGDAGESAVANHHGLLDECVATPEGGHALKEGLAVGREVLLVGNDVARAIRRGWTVDSSHSGPPLFWSLHGRDRPIGSIITGIFHEI